MTGQLSASDASDVLFEPPCKEQEISIRVTVEDNNGGIATDDVSIDVSGSSFSQPFINRPPTVEASAEPESITYSYCNNIPILNLHSSGSDDGNIVSYLWEQTQGSPGDFLEGNEQSDIMFQPPCKEQTIKFIVTVEDNNGATANDETTVIVKYQIP